MQASIKHPMILKNEKVVIIFYSFQDDDKFISISHVLLIFFLEV